VARRKRNGRRKLNPDGVPIRVPWGDIQIGESIFVPCINIPRCVGQIQGIGGKFGMRFAYRTVIEHGILGLRAWRTT
jgi:hypothetical protein